MMKAFICNGCGAEINLSDKSISRLALKAIPPVDYFLKTVEESSNVSSHNLCIIECPQCSLVQIEDSPPPEYFYDNYIYTSTSSPDMLENFQDLKTSIISRITRSSDPVKILDIGCNDGLFLKLFSEDSGFDLYGTDPSPVAADAVNSSYKLHREYFPGELTFSNAPYDVVVGTNSLAHIPYIGDCFRAIRNIMSDQGLFVMEVSDLMAMAKESAWDYIYHEHLYYYTRKSILNLFSMSGLEVECFQDIATKGGSLRVFARKKAGQPIATDNSVDDNSPDPLLILKKSYENCLDAYSRIAQSLPDSSRVYGYGACATGSVAIAQHHLFERLDCIIDDNKARQGLYSPKYAIPVVSLEKIRFRREDVIVIFAWRFMDIIVDKVQTYCQENKFPVPRFINSMHPF